MIVDKLAIGIVQTLSPFYYLRSPALVFPFPGKTISVSSVAKHIRPGYFGSPIKSASGTRKEHLLLSPHELQTVAALRRRLLNMQPVVQVQQLIKALERFPTNADLIGDPK